jgi:Tol biopolymer transport system component
MKHIAAAILAAALMAGAQTRDDADRLLKAAQNTELVDGNLNAAIKQYGALVAKYAKTDRTVTATALVRMADCYRKMGDAESRRIYEQVVREYGDQKKAVALARERLGPGGGTVRMTNTRVWSGIDNNVSEEGVSRDGRFISYTDYDTGDLGVREVATGQDRRITDTKQKKGDRHRRFAEDSAISPDSRVVAYNWYDEDNGKRYELWLANLTGDPNPRRLYSDAPVAWIYPADWSPDGKTLAVVISLKGMANRDNQIGLISVPDGGLHVIKTGACCNNLRFSPDGNYLAYDTEAAKSGPERNLFVMKIDGTGEMPVGPHRGRNIMIGWSPDGSRILFASDRSGVMSLYSLAFTGGKPQGEPELIRADLGEPWPLGITRSGALYYSVNTGRPMADIQVRSLDVVTGRTSAPREVSQNYLESDTSPLWSRDGKYLAYLSKRGRTWDAPSYIVIRSADTLQMVREFQPKLRLPYNLVGWSRDGRFLLARGHDSQPGFGFFRIDTQTGEHSQLLAVAPEDGLKVFDPAAWAPDEKSIFLKRTSADGKETAFVRHDLATGAETDLIRRPNLGGLNAGGLSPDGRYLMTRSSDAAAGTRQMLLIPLDGGEPRVAMSVSATPEELKDPAWGVGLSGWCWTPDSQSFIALKRRLGEKDGEVWQIPVDGGEPRKLGWKFNESMGGYPNAIRGSVATVQTEQAQKPSTEVWVLDHFLPTSGK